MKKQLIILLTAAFVVPVLAEETNEPHHRRGDGRRSAEKRERPELTEQQRKEHMERRYQFMDKALSDIGVSDEDRIKIRELQATHRNEMKSAGERLKAAQVKLSKLLDNGSTDEEVDAAIKEISNAQTEQLKLIVSNRREMEKLLGREKYARFMENARKQYHKHDRRGGSGMPPRPGLPPIPGQGRGRKDSKLPPIPETQPQE